MTMTPSDEAKIGVRQHKTPCHDCPWRRNAIRGWLGPNSPELWTHVAHSDEPIRCHTRRKADDTGFHCAGAATFRANVCKVPNRQDARMDVPQNKTTVFATDDEFIDYHRDSPFWRGRP